MLTNARWLLTTVPLTPIVQILWDHSSARVEQDILVMAKTCQGKSSLVHAAYKWSDSRVEQTHLVKQEG